MSDVSEDVYRGLPRRIHIGPYTFRIVIAAPESCDHLEDADGICVFEQFRIYVSENLPLQRAVNVIQHEVTHAINFAYGIDDDSTEEQFTTNHSTGQVEVWIRNPRLMNWLVKQVRRMKKEASHD